jgi:hypothetical protein
LTAVIAGTRLGGGAAPRTASDAQRGFIGSFAEFQTQYGTTLGDYVGAYGVDRGTHGVWAVLNHNSIVMFEPCPLDGAHLAIRRFFHYTNLTELAMVIPS